ncbi:deoxynucleoside kinase, partial [Candidatus Uhrbacteria bacterium]|nr:deoxynucleoside kinase [Candidatus Uhrbacteria bacterium]
YENAEIFARYLYEKGHIIDRDWNIYEEIYRTAVELLKPPHLIIYLQASVPSLIERIKTRGRSFEQDMDEAYLQDLNRLYESWAMHFTRAPILTIHTDQIRYLDDPAEWQHVLGMINDRIGGTQLSARL